MFADLIVSFLFLILGLAIIIIWLSDINNSPDIDMQAGFFRARDRSSNNLLFFHLMAEMITGILLILSGIILLAEKESFYFICFFSAGALFYTSLNSLSWAFAYKRRYPYAFPMLGGLAVSLLAIFLLSN